MLTNFESIEALQGKASLYIAGALMVVVFSFIPILYEIKSKKFNYLILFIILEIVLCFASSFRVKSPAYNYIVLVNDYYDSINLKNKLKNVKALKKDFENDEIKDCIKKPNNLNKPNVVLIFVEGLSKSIMEETH